MSKQHRLMLAVAGFTLLFMAVSMALARAYINHDTGVLIMCLILAPASMIGQLFCLFRLLLLMHESGSGKR